MSRKFRKKRIDGIAQKANSGDPKMYIPNTLYAFTINPKDSLQGVQEMNSLERAKRFKIIISKLNTFFDIHELDYLLYPEISTPEPFRVVNRTNVIPRLHYHGYIKINHITSFYLNDYIQLIKKIGIIAIKPLTDIVKWNNYVTKDSLPMKIIMKELGLPYALKSKKEFKKQIKNHIKNFQKGGKPNMMKATPTPRGECSSHLAKQMDKD